MLNVAVVVDLCHQFLPAMVERGDGAVINVASTAAFQPLPFEAVYGASKAFVLSFSEAPMGGVSREGCARAGALSGATATEFFAVLGTENAAVGTKETPEKVVRTGLRALEQGRLSVISGASNTLLATMPRFAPRALVAQIAARAIQPRKR